jgi:uncharacterized protein YbaA (DUF1428 family)
MVGVAGIECEARRMPRYVDGFVIPIKKKNISAYRKMAALGCKVWMKHGALDYYECVGDDLKVPWGLTFPRLCKLKPDETAVFAFVVYKSKAHRKQVNKKVMSDPSMSEFEHKEMPFDTKRFATGGFKVIVSA